MTTTVLDTKISEVENLMIKIPHDAKFITTLTFQQKVLQQD